MKAKTTGWVILGGVGIALVYILLRPLKVLAGDTQTFLARIFPYTPIISECADELGLDEKIIKTLVWTESSGFPEAKRKENGYYSWGFTGLTLDAARDEGFTGEEKDLLDPRTNLYYGSAYLKMWLDKVEGNLGFAYSSYNGGYSAYYYYLEEGRFLNPIRVNRFLEIYQKVKEA